MKEIYSVWIDGQEINDYYLTIKEARALRFIWLGKGYKPIIRKELKGGLKE